MHRYLFIVITLFVLIESPAWAVEFSASMKTQSDMMTQVKAQIPEGKFYFKDADTYRTEGAGIINIVKEKMVYQIVSDTKKYVVQKIDEMAKDQPIGHYGDTMSYIKKHKMKESGKETIQGYKCTIYEGSISLTKGRPATPTKIWYAKKLNSMIKQEMNMGPPMGNMVIALENIKTGKLDKGLFELPEGYTKVNDIQEAMGMGAFKIPGSKGEEGKMPSPEEMEKIMKELEKMTKQ